MDCSRTFWIFIFVTPIGVAGKATWRYGDNALGQEHWPELFPDQCGGLAQSPIDINIYETVYNPDIPRFTFTSPTAGSNFVVFNTGHCIQVNTSSDIYMYGGGLEGLYKIDQFHFHWGDNSQHGAEHSIDGVEYPLELHIVSWNAHEYSSFAEAKNYVDGISVLAILFEISMYDNRNLEPIIQAIPQVADPDWNYYVEIPAMQMENLLPSANDRLYRYSGSLTTPTCLESVAWTVYDQKLRISERQLSVFRRTFRRYYRDTDLEQGGSNMVKDYLVNNYRPLQPLNGRTVYRSFQVLPTAN